jgi:predicted nucleotide-binding protein (sugar kinase/HSP70/actin superfamily)
MSYPVFTDEMKKTYTILIPDMLSIHFKLISCILQKYGYHTELIQDDGRQVKDEGLKNVHNDSCYPALLVIGQFITALKSGRYDVNKTAVMISQTGGGCRASNYFSLLRKALVREFPQVPVISLNFSGLEKGNSVKYTTHMVVDLCYAVLYGDMLMSLYNQTRPYEKDKGEADRILDECFSYVFDLFDRNKFYWTQKHYLYLIKKFDSIKIPVKRKPMVGVVGEIYVKYSKLANNHLNSFLIDENMEVVDPGLMDFVLYCCVNAINDHTFYDINKKTFLGWKIAYAYGRHMVNKQIKALKNTQYYAPFKFEDLRNNADKIISQGVKMGEGWLIPAEMIEMVKTGVNNIVCTQPFGCLPNHIVGKGMIRSVKNFYPDSNIVAIDYDPSQTPVNQENRIKLMISNIKS